MPQANRKNRPPGPAPENETCMDQVVKQTEHIPGMAKQVSAIWDVVSK